MNDCIVLYIKKDIYNGKLVMYVSSVILMRFTFTDLLVSFKGFGLISTQTNYGELHIGVTTFQMAVLLLFNERQTYTYKELLVELRRIKI
jgi:hypothetical protein